MRRFAVRQRPLQPGKRIRIFHLTADGSFISDSGDRVAANLLTLEDSTPEKASNQNKARISIPKPPIKTIPNYDTEVSHSFKRSNGFVKYIPLTIEEEANRVEYNLDYNDEMWLLKHKLYGDTAAESKKISLELFECMMDCAEKYSGEHKSEPTADILETLYIQKLQFSRLDSHEVCKHILDYWKKKRRDLGKPLLRRYWPLTSVTDSNPNLTFRPRCKDEHYRLRKKSRPNDEIFERMIELRANLEHGRVLCQLTHKREQLKLKKLLYVYETVVENHYQHMNSTDQRTLTYNLKDMFVYEGRTSSILSATSSANAYATFNPVISQGFTIDSRFGVSMTTLTEEMDDMSSLTTSSQTITSLSLEEKHYLYLQSLLQLGGVYDHQSFIPCQTPTLIINQSGITERSGRNWLLPVASRDNYEHYYDDTVSDQSFTLSVDTMPMRTRLRGRTGRGGRLVIDRIQETKPLFGDDSHEIYRGSLPIASVRHVPHTTQLTTTLKPDLTTLSETPLPDISLTPTATATTATAIPVAPIYVAPVAFTRCKPSRSNYKRMYQEVMPDQTSLSCCNLDAALTFNMASEMTVHVEYAKRLILNRNSVNDQVQFFL